MAQVEEMKVCSKCGDTLALSSFYLVKRKDRIKTAYTSKCKQCLVKINAEYQKANPEKNREKAKKWREANPEKHKETWMAYRERNVETTRKRCSDWRHKNKEYANQLGREWAKNNPAKAAANAAKRRAYILKATPSWADTKAIFVEYELAKWCSDMMGVKYHVDHIIPLKSTKVCGLHVHNNLRVIPASDNLSKSNSFKEQ